jgi:hypothetical protein
MLLLLHESHTSLTCGGSHSPSSNFLPHRAGVIVRALSISPYVYALMPGMALTRKGYSNFLLAIILAEYARRQERQQRLQQDRVTMEG